MALVATRKQMYPVVEPVIHPHKVRCTDKTFNGWAVCVFITVSVINVTFLPCFQKEALKRDLNRKRGTSEISQATTAWWIIQSKRTCSHICRGMQECVFIFRVALIYLCLILWCVCFCFCFYIWFLVTWWIFFYNTIWTMHWQWMHIYRELHGCPF